jgi:hypothetical protein
VFLCIHIYAPPVWPLPTPTHIHAYTCVCGQMSRSCEHGERVSAHDIHHVRHKRLQTLGFFSNGNCYVITCHAFRSCDRDNSGSDAKNALPMHIIGHKNTYPIVAWWQCPTLVSEPRVMCAHTLASHSRYTHGKLHACFQRALCAGEIAHGFVVDIFCRVMA